MLLVDELLDSLQHRSIRAALIHPASFGPDPGIASSSKRPPARSRSSTPRVVTNPVSRRFLLRAIRKTDGRRLDARIES
jgi:hypothetical protein